MPQTDFHQLVTREMDRRGWNVFRLEQEADIPKNTIRRWISGERETVRSNTLERIFDALELQVRPKKAKR